jgi:nucleotide-binding universal stress UspA family protein
VDIFPTRILLAIADSEEADLATHKAVSLANSTGSELHLVHVGQLPNRFMEDPDILGFNRKLYDEIERNTLEALWKLTLQVEVAGGAVDGAHLGMGGVAEKIVRIAGELEADLIVMGSRGHGGLRRAIEGSISDTVVRRAHCPVMIVRTRKGEEHRGFWRKIFSRPASLGLASIQEAGPIKDPK